MRVTTLWLGLLAAGCYPGENLPPYYENRVDPVIDAIEPLEETGNAGGQEVTLSGSGFGTDPDRLVVRFGERNAEILSVQDDALVVRSPAGPLTGGAVDVVVATPDGYTLCLAPSDIENYPGETCEHFYTYDTAVEPEQDDPYLDQQQFILIQNLWTSCYGGMYDNPSIGGCDTIAYFGQTGLDGLAEFYRFGYPRLHTASQGFVTGSDVNPEWLVTEQFEQPFPTGVDSLRREVGSFTLTNPVWEGDEYCADLARAPADNESRTCSGIDIHRYPLDTLQFCETRDPVDGFTRSYRADWPVKEDFFEGPDGVFDAATVYIDLSDPDAEVDPGLVDYPITVPPPIAVRAESGFDDPDLWPVSGMADCPDGNGDGEATLDEDGILFSWEPIEPGVVTPDDDRITAVRTYVHVSVSFLNVGWFLGDGWGLRASIVVPDDHDYDEETGRSYLGIPNTVLYQFPTPNAEWTVENPALDLGVLGTFEDEPSFMILETHRMTDYRVETDAGVLVLSYMTGDMTFPEWRNPALADTDCADCLDADGDGWTDFLDPDCNRTLGGAMTEANLTSSYTCNDGLDNDGDGFVDADDEKCLRGWDAESNCFDGIDNDGDGWVDEGDGECEEGDPFAQEIGEDDASWTCSDGIDSDGDGWVDADDPACTVGSDLEDDGFLGNACNNGEDDDGDGYTDADDLYCWAMGALAEEEAPPSPGTGCTDAADNDTDGFVDARDPDCDLPPGVTENAGFLSPDDYPMVTECYDGIDNDGDGRADADDSHCWNSLFTFAPDGLLPSESILASGQASTGCNDGLDGDEDGWIDTDDPDCLPNRDSQVELGTGTTECNDGIDNNDDGKIDAESQYCADGFGNFEGP